MSEKYIENAKLSKRDSWFLGQSAITTEYHSSIGLDELKKPKQWLQDPYHC